MPEAADLQRARHVDGHRLGHVDVQAGLDGGGGVFGEEVGRRFQDHGLHAAFDQPLVGRQAGEALRLVGAQRRAGLFRAVREVVGRRHELVAAVLLEEPGDPASPAAAADQADLDLAADLGGRRAGFGLDCGCRGQGDAGGRGLLEERATRDGGVLVHGDAFVVRFRKLADNAIVKRGERDCQQVESFVIVGWVEHGEPVKRCVTRTGLPWRRGYRRICLRAEPTVSPPVRFTHPTGSRRAS